MMDSLIDLLKQQWFFSLVLAVPVIGALLTGVAYSTLFERKVAAWVQDRHGPNRVGFFDIPGLRRVWGLGQPLADGLKFFTKEDYIPEKVDKPLYIAAPAIGFIVAMLGMAVIPWGGVLDVDGDGQWDVRAQVASIDVGLLYLLGVGAMGVYGVVLGGWASNNKYSLYGALRACAQMISYEIPLGLGILVVVLMAGSVRLEEIVLAQVGDGNTWYIVKHPLAFLMVWTAMFAETNRMPFDLPEAEQELVSGYLTEYGSMKFSLFFMGEYTHMIIGSAFLATLFLGGWHLPLIPWNQPEAIGWLALLFKIGAMAGKIAIFMFLYMVVRWTLPRFRFDQLMRACWQRLIPIGIGLAAVAIAVVYLRGEGMALWTEVLLCWAGNGLVLLAAVVISFLAQWRGERLSGRQENLPRIGLGYPPVKTPPPPAT